MLESLDAPPERNMYYSLVMPLHENEAISFVVLSRLVFLCCSIFFGAHVKCHNHFFFLLSDTQPKNNNPNKDSETEKKPFCIEKKRKRLRTKVKKRTQNQFQFHNSFFFYFENK